MAWRSFRQIYLDARRAIINETIKNASGCIGKPSAQQLMSDYHQPHFSDADEMLPLVGIDVPDQINEIAAFEQKHKGDALASYDAICRSYIPQWREQLSNCSYSEADKDTIIERLIEVCKNGADEKHPLGSSSVMPSSTYQYRSFEHVIEDFNSTHNMSENAACAYM